jgi:hypothetical protein
MTTIKVNIDEKEGIISISNDGNNLTAYILTIKYNKKIF